MTETHRLLRFRRSALCAMVVLLLFSIALGACAAASPTPAPTLTSPLAPQLPTNLIRGCRPLGARTSRGPDVGELAIDFTLRDVDGNEHTLSQLLADKPVVLIFGSFT
ncbi:MAG: hypothetical protein JSW37_05640 [Anaerolineales bacterium]|nr:MAG: hypothetical protein JSW37_05640 [Anaerolineales bacterium]